MSLKNLAEAIILQSVEDLWDERHRHDCLVFLIGEGFDICSCLAGLKSGDKSKLVELISGLTGMVSQGRDNEYFVGGR